MCGSKFSLSTKGTKSPSTTFGATSTSTPLSVHEPCVNVHSWTSKGKRRSFIGQGIVVEIGSDTVTPPVW